jgi:hypothetical protein
MTKKNKKGANVRDIKPKKEAKGGRDASVGQVSGRRPLPPDPPKTPGPAGPIPIPYPIV